MAILITQGPNTAGYVYPAASISASSIGTEAGVILLGNTFALVSPTCPFWPPLVETNTFPIRPEPIMVGRVETGPPIVKNPFLECVFEGGAAGQAAPNASGLQPQAVRVSERVAARQYPLPPPTVNP